MFDRYDALPLSSRLIPHRWRQSMLGLFDIARGADAIADDPSLSLHERRLKLASLREGLLQHQLKTLPVWAWVHAHDIKTGILSAEYAMQLLDAFLADTFTTRYRTLQELERYCALSTAPLGRGFLAIAGETHADGEASDALCTALQLLNHWRDLGEDARTLGRIYLPQEWSAAAGAKEEDILNSAHLTPAWATVLERLDAVIAEKLERAAALSPTIAHRRLRFHTRWLWHSAKSWHDALRGQDVLARRISPTKRMALHAAWKAL